MIESENFLQGDTIILTPGNYKGFYFKEEYAGNFQFIYKKSNSLIVFNRFYTMISIKFILTEKTQKKI